ncbi:cytochrome c oxidase assembly protein [Microbacterium sp.]|uniref:cytochrome c oxidase assembly protein n=1 Tax=Microbacterium sp. TaxID=51671 RepID=UPI0025FC020A|nr:cytochrome c oxidase assembly protein [Microbacterium sp.]MBT9605041.1 bifunctional copper resistance protein CopD/cytochrome c oxidase assembly protein [Microbacterium sp.]
MSKLMVNLSAAGMGGALFVALFTMRPDQRGFEIALDAAAVSAAIFTVASAATGFFGFMVILNPSLDAGPEFGAQLGRYLSQTEGGRVWLITTIVGSVLTVLIFAVRSWGGTAAIMLLALAALVPMGTQGHSGDEASHQQATTAIVLHIIAAAVWLGGLLLMVMIRPASSKHEMVIILTRYSTIALVAFAIVAFSGTVRAAIGLETLDAVASPYGLILFVKVTALAAMGALGAMYRVRLLRRMRAEPERARLFWLLVSAEMGLMGVASGAAAALARTPPPIAPEPSEAPTPAEILTGAPLPAEWTVSRWFTAWSPDLVWVILAAFGVIFYVGAVLRLKARGHRWNPLRSAAWITGLLLMVWVTSGALGVYRSYLVSAHTMTVVLLLVAVVPLLTVGAPIQLGREAARRRKDGSRGGYEWARVLVRSRAAQLATQPIVAALIAAAMVWIFVSSDLIRWVAGDLLGRQVATAGILVSGFLLARGLTGDETRVCPPIRVRLLAVCVLAATMATIAAWTLGTAGLVAADWFGAMGRTWGPTPDVDQDLGGVALAVGSVVTLVLGARSVLQSRTPYEQSQELAAK